MSTFIIADVHGHLAALRGILGHINLQQADTLITLGDYIDRGPDSKGVIDQLLLLQTRCTLIPLLGNHEEMMLNCRGTGSAAARVVDPRLVVEWLMNGGDAALDSYDRAAMRTGDTGKAFAAIPPSHWAFLLNTCKLYYETPTHIFAHAAPDPNLPMDKQDEYTLRWERFNDPAPHISGKHVICGHTPQRSGYPRHIGQPPHATCLDTGIHVGRHLTCLHLETNQLIQSDPAGKLRFSNLDDHLVKANPV